IAKAFIPVVVVEVESVPSPVDEGLPANPRPVEVVTGGIEVGYRIGTGSHSSFPLSCATNDSGRGVQRPRLGRRESTLLPVLTFSVSKELLDSCLANVENPVFLFRQDLPDVILESKQDGDFDGLNQDWPSGFCGDDFQKRLGDLGV